MDTILYYIPHFLYLRLRIFPMTKKKLFVFPFFPIAAFFIASLACTEKKPLQREDHLLDFQSKKDVTIVVTDSGLGGLSILADAVQRIRQARAFRSVRFVFFNALFSNQGGYNSLRSKEEKIKIFDSALEKMASLYEPDLIIIGCNTLSVLSDETPFAQSTRIPVVGIVDAGVEMISSQLKLNPESIVLIFATQTTLEERKHKNGLIKKGFLPERIKEQACPELVSYIERGYDSEETEMLIYAYVDEALQKIRNQNSPLLVSLNCTHYGFSMELWKNAFENLGIIPLAYLDPNTTLNDFLLSPRLRGRFGNTETSVEVISMVEISEEQIGSIGGWLEPVSPSVSEALQNYTLNRTLFPWKKFILPSS